MTTLVANSLGRLGALPMGYLLLWCGLVTLTVVLIVLVATKWGKSHPVATCGVLSLLAHVLLACVATIVRLVASAEQVAEGPPIRVRIVDPQAQQQVDSPPMPQPENTLQPVVLDEQAAEESTPAVDKSLPAEPELPSEVPEPEPNTNDAAAPATADPPSAEPEPKPEPETGPETAAPPAPAQDRTTEPLPEQPTPTETTEEAAPQEAPARDVEPLTAATSPPAFEAVAPPPPPDEPASVPVSQPVESTMEPVKRATTQYVTTPADIPRPYSNRQRSDRLGFVEREGGNRETEAAVRAALQWLEAAQSRDGRWDASRFAGGEERAVLGHDRAGAGTRADTGVSALALLAFLGAGYTHQTGEYSGTVQNGIQYLTRQQAADGNLGGEAMLYARMYCHSMATFALAEAMAITRDPRLGEVVEKATSFSVRAQNTSSGGWRYRPGQSGDTSQLGWQLMALRSAELAGLHVPSQTWTTVERFLKGVARGQAGGLASYRADGPASRSMTAEALYCRQLLSEAVGGRIEPASAVEASQALLAEPPGSGQFNLYYWYYATLALHHQKQSTADAASAWRKWNEAMKSTLLGAQIQHGREAGSWSPETVWGGYGGRVYSTALAALCLEVYYRYAPTHEENPNWIATEQDNVKLKR